MPPGPVLRLVAVDLDHFRLHVLREQRARRVAGDQRAVVDHREARRQPLGLVHEVRGEQDRLALRDELAQAVPDQVARLRIEPRGRLVEDQEIGVVDQRARERQAPLHAARERADRLLALAREAGELEQPRDARLDHAAGDPEVAPVDPQVLGDGEVGIEVVHLRDDADADARLARRLRHGLAAERDRAAVGVDEAEAAAQRRGLARAVRPEQREALAAPDVEGQSAHDLLAAVALHQSLDRQDRGGARASGDRDGVHVGYAPGITG